MGLGDSESLADQGVEYGSVVLPCGERNAAKARVQLG